MRTFILNVINRKFGRHGWREVEDGKQEEPSDGRSVNNETAAAALFTGLLGDGVRVLFRFTKQTRHSSSRCATAVQFEKRHALSN